MSGPIHPSPGRGTPVASLILVRAGRRLRVDSTDANGRLAAGQPSMPHLSEDANGAQVATEQQS